MIIRNGERFYRNVVLGALLVTLAYFHTGCGGSDGDGGPIGGEDTSGLLTVTIAADDDHVDEGGDTATFTVTLNEAATQGLTINYTVAGTTTAGDDFSLPGSLVVEEGQTTGVITLTPVDDTDSEENETVTITLVAGNGYAVGGSPDATIVIIDNDRPTLTISAENDLATEAGETSGHFRIDLNIDAPEDFTIRYTISGTAGNGTDYEEIQTTSDVSKGDAAVELDIKAIDDSEDEGDETVVITLLEDPAYNLGTEISATINIRDNDRLTASVNAVESEINEEGPGKYLIQVELSKVHHNDMSITYVLSGTATAGEDYTALPGAITIPAGDTIASIEITPEDDESIEGTESVLLTIQDGEDYDVGEPADVSISIIDNDKPTLTALTNTKTIQEGGEKFGRLDIDIDIRAVEDIEIFFTLTGSATNGADYEKIESSVTLVEGGLGYTVLVTLIDDTLEEGPEEIVFTLQEGPSYYLGSTISTTITIEDDDVPTGTITATTPNATETDTIAGVFTVELPSSVETDTVVDYEVTGSATAGDDYAALPGSVVIKSGERSASILVVPVDDNSFEGNETVTVALRESASSATVTIIDNEMATVSVAASTPDAYEKSLVSGWFQIQLSTPITESVTVEFTATGSATLGDDYPSAFPSSITIPAGETTADIELIPVQDGLYEPSETVVLTIKESVNYEIASPDTATVTIHDDVPVVSLNLTDAEVMEDSSTPATLTVELSEAYFAEITVAVSIAGTATQDVDFEAPSSATISAGETTGTVQITPLIDAIQDINETVVVTLLSGEGYQLGPDVEETVTIRDVAPTVTIEATDASASESPDDNATFTFSLSGVAGTDVELPYLLTGTATAGDDYKDLGVVTIKSGQSSATLTLEAVYDATEEPIETVIVALDADAGHFQAGNENATATITSINASLWGNGVNGFGSGVPSRFSVTERIRNDVEKISLNGWSAAYLYSDGSLWTVGRNLDGELGVGDKEERKEVELIVNDGVVDVAMGLSHALFVTNDGKLWGMGANVRGSLGPIADTDSPVEIILDEIDSDVIAVDTASDTTFFLTSDAKLWGMGRNNSGQLGQGDKDERRTPVQIAADVADFSVGSGSLVYITTGGALYGAGNNAQGQLGLGDDADSTVTVPKMILSSGVSRVSTGYWNTIFSKTDGSLWGMGTNTNAVLGGITSAVPVELFDSGVADFVTSPSNTLVALNDGSLWAAGLNGYGSLFNGTTGWISEFTQTLPPETGVTKVWAGSSYTAYLDSEGDQFFGGSITGGHAGLAGNPASRDLMDTAFTQAKKLAPSNTYLTVLSSDGSVWAAGSNPAGIGDGTDSSPSFTQILESSIVEIAGGAEHTLYIDSDGNLLSMGSNSSGQLGTGNRIPSAVPTPTTVTDVKAASGGLYHSAIVKNNGSLWTVGGNQYGNLGLGDKRPRDRFEEVLPSGVRVVACGDYTTYFVKDDGTLWGMGASYMGELGVVRDSQPTPIMIDTDVVDVAGGRSHTVYLKSNGTIMGCGSSYFGQLGRSQTKNVTPVVVLKPESGVVQFDAASNKTLFRYSDGSVKGLGLSDKFPEVTDQVNRLIGLREMVADLATGIALGPQCEIILRLAHQSPRAGIYMSDGIAMEGGKPGIAYMTLNRAVSEDTTVEYTISGSAVAGIDYTALSGSVELKSGEYGMEILVSALSDAEAEDFETVTITLAPGSGYEVDEDQAQRTIVIRE